MQGAKQQQAAGLHASRLVEVFRLLTVAAAAAAVAAAADRSTMASHSPSAMTEAPSKREAERGYQEHVASAAAGRNLAPEVQAVSRAAGMQRAVRHCRA